MSAPSPKGLLLVEDDAPLANTIARALAPRVGELRWCETAGKSIVQLETWHPDVVLLDFALPDGSAFDVLEALARHAAMPTVIAMSGAAGPDEAFRLAQLGVRYFLQKPLKLDVLEETIARALTEPVDIRPQVRGLVGMRAIHEVETEVRATMINEALARTSGSRRGAARLLAVSRQLLQHMLRKLRG